MRPLLFRLLLCATLLLNGIGSAMASVHVALMDASAGHAAAGAPPAADADCPHATAADPPPSHADHAPSPWSGDVDCLKLCLDICLQHGHALLAVPAPAPAPPARAAPVPPASPGPASVRPYPPLRPPIAA